MSTIAFHALAELFPLMEGAELDELTRSIKENGQRDPIILLDNAILDGRNRYRACLAAAVEPRFKEFEDGDPLRFVVDRNLHRRHLNESQRAMVAARLANIQRGEVGGGHEKADTQISISEAAKLLNVSPHIVSDAKTIISKGTPEEIQSAERGTGAVSTIGRRIRANLPPKERQNRLSGTVSQSGKNPARIQRQQINAEIWGRVRDSLVHLTSLPLPSDVATIARINDKTGLVDKRLAASLQWLQGFSDVWHSNRDETAA